MRSAEIEICLDGCIKEFKNHFSQTSYEQTMQLSLAILNLEQALAQQIKIEKLSKIESEDK